MTFAIIDDITVPASTVVRNRPKGEFAVAVAGLAVGQGFFYTSEGTLKTQYPKVAPKKFDGKKFKVWAHPETPKTFGVKRLPDASVEAPVEAPDAE